MMIRKARHSRAEPDVLGALDGSADEDLRRGDQLPARRVVFADPGLVVAEPVEPLEQFHVAREREVGIFAEAVERGEEDAEGHTFVGHGPDCSTGGRVASFGVPCRAMNDKGIHLVREHLAKLPPSNTLTIEQRRAQYERAERVFPTPPDVKIETIAALARPAERLTPPSVRTDAFVLYLHGGGYVIGSPRSHRHLAAAIARAAGTRALLLDYRLAPEHPFPAALEDAVAAYQWLLTQGIAAERVVVAGDSAGGGLTVATLITLRDRGLPRPAGGVCISPWVDLTNSAESYVTKAAVDPIVTRDGIEGMTQAYVGGGDRKAPLVSPLYADLRDLPPLLVQVGSDEVLLDDARGLGQRAKAAGVDVTVEEWPSMIHVWHWFLPMLDEAEHAIDVIGRFVRRVHGAA